MEPKLYEKYVENGTLRIEWRDFPYLGEKSVDAAVAARAAQAQGKFWKYHDLLYENQASGFSDEKLQALAEKAGLDAGRFARDYEDAGSAGPVQKDFREGQRLGVNGTPTFVINDRVLVGLQPVGVFEETIEEARREAEGG